MAGNPEPIPDWAREPGEPVPVPAASKEERAPKEGEPRHCRCPLCGKMIVAATQDECIAHIGTCGAFSGVHPEGKETNYQYYNEEKVKKHVDAKDANSAGSASASEQPAAPLTSEMVQTMGVKDLKALIQRAGLRSDNCVEKSDLRERALEAVAALNKSP